MASAIDAVGFGGVEEEVERGQARAAGITGLGEQAPRLVKRLAPEGGRVPADSGGG